MPLFLYVSAAGHHRQLDAGALSGFPERAGAVSALVGMLADGTPWPLGWVVALCGLGSLASTRLLCPPKFAMSIAGTSNVRNLIHDAGRRGLTRPSPGSTCCPDQRLTGCAGWPDLLRGARRSGSSSAPLPGEFADPISPWPGLFSTKMLELRRSR